MADTLVGSGLSYFADPDVGRPISDGYVYIGKIDLDPQDEANQKPVSLVLSDGSLVSVTQPIRTGKGGTINYNSSTAQIIVDGDYSIKVLDSAEGFVYYVPRNSGTTGGNSGREFSSTVDRGTGSVAEVVLMGLIDENKYNRYGGTGSIDFQVGSDVDVGWEDNTEIFFHLYADGGIISVSPQNLSGVTINVPATGNFIDDSGDSAVLKKVGVDTWDLTLVTDTAALTRISLVNGTQANPSLNYLADLTTGLFMPSPGRMTFSSQGSESVRMSGVGISVDKGDGFQDVATTVEVALKADKSGATFTGPIVMDGERVLLANGLNNLNKAAIEPFSDTVDSDGMGLYGGTDINDHPSVSTGAAVLLYGGVDPEFPMQCRIHFGGNQEPSMVIDGAESQTVLRDGAQKSIVADGDTPTLDGAIFTNDILVDKPGTAEAQINARNDDGGMSIRASNGGFALYGTSASGALNGMVMASLTPTANQFYRPGSFTAQLILDGDDSQKVRRGGADLLIAAEGSTPTFTGALLTGDLLIDSPTTNEAKLDLRNDEIGLSVRVNGSAVVLWRTDAAGAETIGPLMSQGALETNFFCPGSNTGQILLDGNESQKIRRDGAHRQIATLDDLQAIDTGGLPLTGGNMTGPIDMIGVPIEFTNGLSPALTSNINSRQTAGRQQLRVLGGADEGQGAFIILSGTGDSTSPGVLNMGFGGAGAAASFTIDGNKSVKTYAEDDVTLSRVATIADLASFGGNLPLTGGTLTGSLTMDKQPIYMEATGGNLGSIRALAGSGNQGVAILGGDIDGGKIEINGPSGNVPDAIEMFFGTAAFPSLTVSGANQVLAWSEFGDVYNQVATLADLPDTGLPVTGGTLTGDLSIDGFELKILNASNGAASTLYAANASDRRYLIIQGEGNTTGGGYAQFFGSSDSIAPGNVQLFYGFGNTVPTITLDGAKSAKAWNNDGTLFNQIATLDDITSIGGALPLTGGVLSGTLEMNGANIIFRNPDTPANTSGLYRSTGVGRQTLTVGGGDGVASGGFMSVYGANDNTRANQTRLGFGGQSNSASLVIDAHKSVKSYDVAGSALSRVATDDDVNSKFVTLLGGEVLDASYFDGNKTILNNLGTPHTMSIPDLSGVAIGRSVRLVSMVVTTMNVTATGSATFTVLKPGAAPDAPGSIVFSAGEINIYKQSATNYILSGFGIA